MKTSSALHFRLFTRLPIADETTALRLCQQLTQSGPEWMPTAYGANEPLRTPFQPADLTLPAALLWRDAHQLLLRRSRPRWEANLYWLRGRTRPWFWTFDFGADWLREDRLVSIVDTLTGLCRDFSVLYAAGASSADWKDKHDIHDATTGEVRLSEGHSFNPGSGLPGVYWFTYFGPELVAHFGREKLAHIGGESSRDFSEGGWLLLCHPTPNFEDERSRRAREEQVVASLGPQYFFDKTKGAGKRPRHRTPIPGVTDARSLRG